MPKPIHKRLIICCDGTWMSSNQAKTSNSNPTNITRFCYAMQTAQVEGEMQQVVLYQKGIGTGDMNWFEKYIAGGTGFGLDTNVREVYYFLSNNYQNGDEIFLFGYSRGAYTVRAVSGLLEDIGLLNKEGIRLFPDVYAQYQIRKRDPVAWLQYKVAQNLECYKQDVRVVVLGCWDTVGSMGVPDNWMVRSLKLNEKYTFYNTQLSDVVDNAFHCLALDEHRSLFRPTLWYLPPTTSGIQLEDPQDIPVSSNQGEVQFKQAPPHLVQMWFIGTHADIAGGDDPSHYNDCADISFAWMVEQCQGLLEFDGTYLASVRQESQRRLQRVPESGTFTTAGTSGEAHEATVHDRLVIPQSGYAMGHITDTFTNIFKILGSSYRKPGQYFRGDKTKGDTNERIHPSVRMRRVKEPQWKPPALGGFRVIPDPERPGYWLWEKGDLKIPEFPIGLGMKKETPTLRTQGEGLSELSLMTYEDRAYLASGSAVAPPPIDVACVLGNVHVGWIYGKVRQLFCG